MIQVTEYTELRRRINLESEFIKASGKNWFASDEIPTEYKTTNEEKSSVEVYEFMNDKPLDYTAYVNLKDRVITTWTGDILCKLVGYPSARTSYGVTRCRVIYFSCIGINGVNYYGKYYPDSGDYCYLKAYKPQG